jgi:predicted ester cyclase
MVAEGDTVVSRVTDSGIHTGPFLGVEPTVKQLTFSGVNFVDVRDGKIVRSWGTRDRYKASRQLDALT